MRKEVLPIFLAIIFFLPCGYYLAGNMVYSIVADTNHDCWGNFDQNTPEEFTPLRHEVPLSNATYQENITTNIMNGLSQYWWPSHESAIIEVEGLALSAWYHKQPESNNSTPWVIFVHGIRGCKADGSILLPAGMLIDAGYNVIAFDMRDHGESDVEDGFVSAGQKEWRDVVAVHDWLIENQSAEEGRIGLFGNSMGAGTAAITFAQDSRIQVVWLDSPFSDMGKIIEEELEFKGLPTFLGGAGIFAGKIETGEDLTALSPLDAATEIGDRHMYVVHGTFDGRVKVHHGQSMCDEALEHGVEGNVECWIKDSRIIYNVEGENETDEHVTLMLTDTDEYEQRLIAFFDKSFA